MYEETARRFAQAVRRIAPNRRERAIKLRLTQRQIEAYERGEAPRLIESLGRLEQAGVISIHDDTPRCPCGAHAADAEPVAA